MAVVGALGGLVGTGHTLNLFSRIGILLLFDAVDDVVKGSFRCPTGGARHESPALS